MNAWVHTYTKPQTSSTRSRGLGWRIHESVEDTKLSTNKQHTLLTMGGVRRRLIKPRTVLRNQCGRLSRVVTLTKVWLRRGKCRGEQLKRRAHRRGKCAHYHSVKNVQVLGGKRLSLIQENARSSHNPPLLHSHLLPLSVRKC